MHVIPFEVNTGNHLKLIEYKYSLLFDDQISFEYQKKSALIITTIFFQCKMYFGSGSNSVGIQISTAKPSGTFKREFANLLSPLLKNRSGLSFEYSKYDCSSRIDISSTVDGVISKKSYGWDILIANAVSSSSISEPIDYDAYVIVSVFDFFLTRFYHAYQSFINNWPSQHNTSISKLEN